MRLILFSFIFFILISKTLADEGIYTYAKSNNIYYYSKTKNLTLQLTHSGINSDPVLSPDGRWLVYIKRSDFILQTDCLYFLSRGEHGDEIWIYDLKTIKKRLLVADHLSCNDMSKVILDPHDLKFSPDSKTLYFATSAWVTSGAIHAVDIDGKNLRFVTNGNEYHVIMDGHFKGDLIVNQHRYHDLPNGGSYDWDWLYTPTGKQIKLYRKQN